MNRHFTVFVTAISGIAGPLGAAPSSPDRTVQAGCEDDLVVIGRLSDQSYEMVTIPDDLIGHGWITANLTVTKVVRGRSIASGETIRVRYFAHTYRRSDTDVRLGLRREATGIYIVSDISDADDGPCD